MSEKTNNKALNAGTKSQEDEKQKLIVDHWLKRIASLSKDEYQRTQ